VLKIYLTRHGETEWNIQGKLQGWNDSNLTENGIEGAYALHHHLSDINIDAIYSSPLGRAMKTSEIIAGERGIEIIEEPNFKEVYLGDWEGRTGIELEELYSEQYYNFWHAPHLYRTEKGESFSRVQDRAIGAIHKIVETRKSGNILIVTHGVTLKLILAYFESRSLEDLWKSKFVKNTSLSLIEFDGEEYQIALYADSSHIADAY